MPTPSDPLTADLEFFRTLVAGDADFLRRLLTDEFLLIDVMSGGEITREALCDVIQSGTLRFERIEPADGLVRTYDRTAIVTGRTEMAGRYADTPFAVRSRYTHVYVERDGCWRMVSAQGTQIRD